MTDAVPVRNHVAVVGASIPRSGHHFLSRILRSYFGEEIRYCSYYKVKNCCKQIPCVRNEGKEIVYQKHHDQFFTLPPNLPGVTYIVQHRHPVPEALSDLELHIKRHAKEGKRDYTTSRRRFISWLGRKIWYYKMFHDKWIAPAPHNAILVDYEDLARDTVGTVEEILIRLGLTPSRERLEAAVASVQDYRTPNQVYKPRVVEDSKHFDRELFSEFESMILELCPSYGYERMLTKVPFEGRAMYRSYRIRMWRRFLPEGLGGLRSRKKDPSERRFSALKRLFWPAAASKPERVPAVPAASPSQKPVKRRVPGEPQSTDASVPTPEPRRRTRRKRDPAQSAP
jgi:hypothetical protein